MRRLDRLVDLIYLTAFIITVIVAVLGVLDVFRERISLQKQLARFEAEALDSRKEDLRLVVGNAVDFLRFQHSKIEERLREGLRGRVAEACTLAQNVYLSNRGRVPAPQLSGLVLQALRSLRFAPDGGTCFVLTMDGTRLLSTEPDGVSGPGVQTLLQQVREEGEAFDVGNRPAGAEPDGLFFARHFAPLGWVIGAWEERQGVEESIRREAVQWVGEVRFHDTGYLWIHDTGGRLIVHPYCPKELRPQWYQPGGLLSYSDRSGKNVFQDAIDLCRERGSGFLEYGWSKPGSETEALKISFVQDVPEWGCIVGGGVYLDELKDSFRDHRQLLLTRFRHRLCQMLLIALTILGLTIGLACFFHRRLEKAFERFGAFFDTAAVESRRIDPRDLPFAEFKALAGYANRMIEEREEYQRSLHRSEEQLLQSRKMEAIGRLAGGIAHDFNNLLTAVIGYSELVLWKEDLEADVRTSLAEIQKTAYRAGALTQQLLAFGRKQVLQPDVLNLNNVIMNLEDLLRRLIGEDVALQTRPDPDLGLVEADRSQIEQVILNLVVNARDALPEGGTITLLTRNLDLGEGGGAGAGEDQPGLQVVLEVRDTGIGMDEQTLEHLFEPFFTTKGSDSGTGLGLSTVYGIVQQSGGTIRVRSRPGEGSTFTICLPRVHRPEGLEGEPVQNAILPGGEETILVVEDEPVVRQMLGAGLRQVGYRVLEAENGREALRVAGSNGWIDLLLTDLIMPDIPGDHLARQLSAGHPEVSVLYMSGYARRRKVDKECFLQKPFSPQVLCEKVRTILDLAKARGRTMEVRS